MERNDGSIQSSNTPSNDSYQEEAKDYSIYRCLIIKTKYTDDPQNTTKDSPVPEVMYDCQIIGGFREGHIISNVRVSQDAGGQFNFSERIFKQSSAEKSEAGLSTQDGDIVYVSFVAGDQGAGIILGGGNHVLDRDSTGAAKADGPRLRSQYNGIFTEIDKDGHYTFKRLGGTYNATTGCFTPDAEGEAILIEYKNNTITRSVNKKTVTEVVDGDSESITRTYKTGLVIEENGAEDTVKVTTAGGLAIEVDGKADKDIVTVTTKNGAALKIDGKNDEVNLKDNGTGSLKIAGEKVALGANGIELLEKVTASLQSLITMIISMQTETHIANLGYQTAPPTNAADYATAQAEITALKAEIDSIKGTL